MTWIRRHGLVVVVALVGVVLLTWPLAPTVTTALPYATGDGLENTWNIWWAKEALVRRTNPFWGAPLYQPEGTSLYFHALGLAAAPIAIPLQFLVDPPTALVITLLALLWLTALTTYLLLWDLTHHRLAACIGGLFMALAPAHLYYLYMGQLNLTAFFPVPFILFAQQRALQRRQARWVVAGAVGVVVGALADWQYLVQALLVAGLLGLLVAWRQRRQGQRALLTLAWAAAPLVVGLLVLSPLIGAMIADLRATDNYAVRPDWQAERRAVDLVGLLAPSPLHPLWGEAAWGLYERLYPLRRSSGEIIPGRPTLVNITVSSLSLVALAVAAGVAWRRRGPAGRWLVVGVVCVLLALGPHLRVNGEATALVLPYQLFRMLPYMDISRTPAVFLQGALLALAVLLALGLRRLAARLGRGQRANVALAAVGGLLAFEGLAAPLQVDQRPAVSQCYRVLAADPRPGAVLDLPVIDADEPMYYQTVHGRPIFGGDLSRDNPYPFLFGTPVVEQVIVGERQLPDDIYLDQEDAAAQARAILAGWGVQWLIFRPNDAGQDRPQFEAMLRTVLSGMTPVCSDDLATLWRLEPRPVALELGDGWYDIESQGAVTIYRWMEDEGEIIVSAPTSSRVQLRLNGWAHQYDRRLQVLVDDRPQGVVMVPAGRPAPVTVPLNLPAGQSTVHLRAIEPPTPGGPTDPRALSVAVTELRLEPATAASGWTPAGEQPR